jgi:hypothetical protein
VVTKNGLVSNSRNRPTLTLTEVAALVRVSEPSGFGCRAVPGSQLALLSTRPSAELSTASRDAAYRPGLSQQVTLPLAAAVWGPRVVPVVLRPAGVPIV